MRRHREKLQRRGEIYSWGTSLICVAPKRLLPVGLNVCVLGEHKIVQDAKVRLLRKVLVLFFRLILIKRILKSGPFEQMKRF